VNEAENESAQQEPGTQGTHRAAPPKRPGRRSAVVAVALAAVLAASVPLLERSPDELRRAAFDRIGEVFRDKGLQEPTFAPAEAEIVTPEPTPTDPGEEDDPIDSGFGLPGFVDETLFGSSLDFTVSGGFDAWVEHVDERFSDLPVVRVFNQGLPRDWTAKEIIEGRTVVVSFKADPTDVVEGRHDAALRRWFASTPPNSDVYWTYFHEPEDDIERGDFTAEEFRDAWRHLRKLADETRRPNLHATLVLMGWSTNPKSGREWTDYYPGGDVIDVIGWDNYNLSARNGRYADPEDIFGRVIEVSEEVGKPWGIAETGSLLVRGDDGTARAEWLGRVGEYLVERGAVWVTYFESTVGGDFRLHDEASRQVWAELVRQSALAAAGLNDEDEADEEDEAEDGDEGWGEEDPEP
jgi:hypothetical protein